MEGAKTKLDFSVKALYSSHEVALAQDDFFQIVDMNFQANSRLHLCVCLPEYPTECEYIQEGIKRVLAPN